AASAREAEVTAAHNPRRRYITISPPPSPSRRLTRPERRLTVDPASMCRDYGDAMSVKLTKDSIDLGIVTADPERSIAFYRDVLGFDDLGEFPMPGGLMRRLQCGTSTIKIVALKRSPAAAAPPGGIGGATGYRYWTISVSN